MTTLIVYEPIAADDEEALCYMCFPPHTAEWRSEGSGVLSLCTDALYRLVREGKAATRTETFPRHDHPTPEVTSRLVSEGRELP